MDLVRAYCGYLEEAYLLFLRPYCTLKLAERMRRPQKKVHAADTGLRNAVCFSGSPDRGRVAETAAWGATVRRQTGEVFYWKGKSEVDRDRLHPPVAVSAGVKVQPAPKDLATDYGTYRRSSR